MIQRIYTNWFAWAVLVTVQNSFLQIPLGAQQNNGQNMAEQPNGSANGSVFDTNLLTPEGKQIVERATHEVDRIKVASQKSASELVKQKEQQIAAVTAAADAQIRALRQSSELSSRQILYDAQLRALQMAASAVHPYDTMSTSARMPLSVSQHPAATNWYPLSAVWKEDMRRQFEQDLQFLNQVIVEGEIDPIIRQDFEARMRANMQWLDLTLGRANYISDAAHLAVTERKDMISALAMAQKRADTLLAKQIMAKPVSPFQQKTMRLGVLYALSSKLRPTTPFGGVMSLPTDDELSHIINSVAQAPAIAPTTPVTPPPSIFMQRQPEAVSLPHMPEQPPAVSMAFPEKIEKESFEKERYDRESLWEQQRELPSSKRERELPVLPESIKPQKIFAYPPPLPSQTAAAKLEREVAMLRANVAEVKKQLDEALAVEQQAKSMVQDYTKKNAQQDIEIRRAAAEKAQLEVEIANLKKTMGTCQNQLLELRTLYAQLQRNNLELSVHADQLIQEKQKISAELIEKNNAYNMLFAERLAVIDSLEQTNKENIGLAVTIGQLRTDQQRTVALPTAAPVDGGVMGNVNEQLNVIRHELEQRDAQLNELSQRVAQREAEHQELMQKLAALQVPVPAPMPEPMPTPTPPVIVPPAPKTELMPIESMPETEPAPVPEQPAAVGPGAMTPEPNHEAAVPTEVAEGMPVEQEASSARAEDRLSEATDMTQEGPSEEPFVGPVEPIETPIQRLTPSLTPEEQEQARQLSERIAAMPPPTPEEEEQARQIDEQFARMTEEERQAYLQQMFAAMAVEQAASEPAVAPAEPVPAPAEPAIESPAAENP